MCAAGPGRGWPAVEGRQRQKGQALLYGIFILLGGLATLFFLFNAGQLTREKTKLVNTTDAVAYSAGVMHARTLNFHAYTNRAMVANTVAIAQLTSLASWVRYVDTLSTGGGGELAFNNPKFSHYQQSFTFAQQFGPEAAEVLIDRGALEGLLRNSDRIISSLAVAQRVAHQGLLPARTAVMREVAEANYRGDGSIEVDALPLTASRDYANFVDRYEGDERTRFREVVLDSLRGDRFVQRRSWLLPAQWSDCGGATASGRVDWVDRRGGTELIGFDEWKAVDTMSEKRWVPSSKVDVFCSAVAESPVSWGAQNAAESSSFDPDPQHYDLAPIITPSPYLIAVATASTWDYSGMPAFHELSAGVRNDPNLRFVIRLRRQDDQTRTSGARSVIAHTPRLNGYQQTAAGGSYAAVSGSEAFFERPLDQRENAFGRGRGTPVELGSLFNPYWQVRLIAPDRDQLRAAQALQNVVLTR